MRRLAGRIGKTYRCRPNAVGQPAGRRPPFERKLSGLEHFPEFAWLLLIPGMFCSTFRNTIGDTLWAKCRI